MDEVECRRRAVLGNTTVKAADAETRRLLARLREGFVARIQAALAPELCAEANVADRLTLAKNWFCAGHARRFLEANLEDGARVVPESVRVSGNGLLKAFFVARPIGALYQRRRGSRDHGRWEKDGAICHCE